MVYATCYHNKCSFSLRVSGIWEQLLSLKFESGLTYYVKLWLANVNHPCVCI